MNKSDPVIVVMSFTDISFQPLTTSALGMRCVMGVCDIIKWMQFPVMAGVPNPHVLLTRNHWT